MSLLGMTPMPPLSSQMYRMVHEDEPARSCIIGSFQDAVEFASSTTSDLHLGYDSIDAFNNAVNFMRLEPIPGPGVTWHDAVHGALGDRVRVRNVDGSPTGRWHYGTLVSVESGTPADGPDVGMTTSMVRVRLDSPPFNWQGIGGVVTLTAMPHTFQTLDASSCTSEPAAVATQIQKIVRGMLIRRARSLKRRTVTRAVRLALFIRARRAGADGYALEMHHLTDEERDEIRRVQEYHEDVTAPRMFLRSLFDQHGNFMKHEVAAGDDAAMTCAICCDPLSYTITQPEPIIVDSDDDDDGEADEIVRGVAPWTCGICLNCMCVQCMSRWIDQCMSRWIDATCPLCKAGISDEEVQAIKDKKIELDVTLIQSIVRRSITKRAITKRRAVAAATRIQTIVRKKVWRAVAKMRPLYVAARLIQSIVRRRSIIPMRSMRVTVTLIQTLVRKKVAKMRPRHVAATLIQSIVRVRVAKERCKCLEILEDWVDEGSIEAYIEIFGEDPYASIETAEHYVEAYCGEHGDFESFIRDRIGSEGEDMPDWVLEYLDYHGLWDNLWSQEFSEDNGHFFFHPQ